MWILHALQMMEAGTRAFVSYVRGYKEHHCRFIFRVQVDQEQLKTLTDSPG
jgi:hypothetical protein